MKEKIFAAIKAKFPKVNLSKKRLEAIAAKIEAKIIDDETKIDAAIDEFNDFNPIVDLAKQDDTIRNLEAKLKTAAPAKKDDKVQDEPEKVVAPDDAPEWAKALLKQNETLVQTMAAMQGKEVANTIRGKATEQLKDIPATYWSKRSLPEKVEDIEAFAEEVKADYQTFTQEMTEKGLSILPAPKGGAGGGNGGGKATEVSPEIKAFVAKNAAEQKVAAAN